MVQFMNLPAPRMPQNALLDFTGISNAIDSNRRNALLQQESARQDEELAMRKAATGRAEARASRQDIEATKARIGKMALAGDSIQDPGQRAAFLDRILKEHPDGANLGPEYRDPSNAFKLIAAEAGLARDPREDRLMDLKLRQAERDLTKPMGSDETFFGSPQYERTKDGKVRAFVLGNRGTKRYVDAEDGGELLGPEGIAAAKARGTVEGREGAEKRMALPKVETSLKMQEVADRVVVEDIDRALKMSENPWATGFVGSIGNYVANTPGSNLSRMLDGIQANIGFDKLQDMRANSPTGGALGAVTERELALLQATYGSLVNSQSVEELQFNLNRLKQIRQEFSALRRQAYERDVQTFGSAAVPNPETGAQQTADPKSILKQKYGVDLE